MSIGRPLLRRSYAEDVRILPTAFQKGLLICSGIIVTLMAFGKFGLDGPVSWFLGNTWLDKVTLALIFAIAALGFNILVGVTGQVSLGHAFFMGVGAYTAVSLGGDGDGWQACVPGTRNSACSRRLVTAVLVYRCGSGYRWLPSWPP
ncbi:MAG: hypothetical protein R2706_02525 [Acidimicrobiales bacterium]